MVKHYFWLLGLVLSYHSALAIDIANIRFGKTEDGGTRIVIEANKKMEYHAFAINNPNRLVVDIPSAKIGVIPKNEWGGIKYRYGYFRKDIMRIVFDIDFNYLVLKNFHLDAIGEYPNRLVFDLQRAANPQNFDKKSAGFNDNTAPINQSPPDNTPNKPAKAKPVVVIDAGHGGIDPGAKGRLGTLEKNITLNIAKKLAGILQKTGNFEAILTRNDDYFVPLRDRFRIAESKQADIFIAIHADSIANPNFNGASIYTLSEQASDKEAQKLAEAENASDFYAAQIYADAPSDIKRILLELGQRNTKQESAILAKNILGKLEQAVPLLNKPHRFAGFAVLKSPLVPSVLIEAGFLSNSQMEKKLLDENYQKLLAERIANGVQEYFKHLQNYK